MFNIISLLLFILTFNFTLSFIEGLHKKDERITKQSRIGAILCLAIGLLLLII
ncbi:MAG TPA: hypothetical protein VK075_07500 [Pseudogracilibacillus sp.]|nr:hypothetical protein [Pseudogracilibacillus sp.]